MSMSIKIGTAPDSWGVWFPEDEYQMPWTKTMAEMEQAGYRGVELGPWGYFPNTYEKLKKALDKHSLDLVATTVGADFSSDQSVKDLLKTIDEIALLQKHFNQAAYVVLLPAMYTDLNTGEQTLPKELSDEEWVRVFANLQKVSDYVKDQYGLVAALHPHVECHIETEVEIEKVLNNTDIALCLDTGHHVYGGGEPVSFYEKHHERIPYVHVKDCDLNVKKEMEKKGWSFAEAVKHDIMCEPGRGGIDFKELFAVMDRCGYDGWVVVEQDLYPAPFDRPFRIARRTYDFLTGCLK